MGVPSTGVAAKWSIGAVGTAVGSYTNAVECLSFGVQTIKEVFDASGIRGRRGRIATRVRPARTVVRGPIRMNPTCNELAILLPYITGSTASGGNYALAESMESNGKFDLLVDLGPRRVTYTGCQVSRARFASRAGSPLELTLDIEGLSGSDSATSFPSVTFTDTDADRPLMHSDCTLTLAGSAVSAFDLEITIDNGLNTNRFVNSLTRAYLPAQDRTVAGRFALPYTSDELALQTTADSTAISDIAGISALAVWAFANVSFTFGASTTYKLQAEGRKPILNSRGEEVGLELSGFFRGAAATQEAIFSLDATV